MTIIVAIVSGNRIVVASDSQTTYGTAKLLNAEKISLIACQEPCQESEDDPSDCEFLVAQSGLSELSARVIEIIQKKAESQRITDRWAVAKLAEESVREVRQQLMSLYKDQSFTQDEWERYFRDENAFELMIAHWFDQKPCLYKLNIQWCVATPITSPYYAIGCGANLGNYLLSELVTPKMPWKAAVLTALYVVEKVKQYDAFCGGPAKLGWVDVLFGGRLFEEDEIAKLIQEVSQIDLATKAERSRQIQSLINTASQKSIPDDPDKKQSD